MVRQERRQHRRTHPRRMEGELHYEGLAELKEISLTGVSIEGRDRCVPGCSYELTLVQDGQTARMVAEAKWCRVVATRQSSDGEAVPVHRSGLEWPVTDPLRSLTSYLRRFFTRQNDDRLTGRFETREKTPVELRCRYPFRVLDVAPNGVGVECVFRPQIEDRYLFSLEAHDSTIEAQGRIAHVIPGRLEGKHARSKFGVELCDLSPRDDELLRAVVEQSTPRPRSR